MAKDLWVETYRPSTIDQYVFKDEGQKRQVQQWVKEGAIPHLLFSGSPGTGKTTLAKVLINELDVQKADVLMINASRDNGVDLFRQKITAFAETMPWGDFKVILLDEADYLSPNAQAILRGVMEQYQSVVRFVLTCNHPNKIMSAIHSRCQGFHIQEQDQVDFTTRIAEILIEQEAKFELEDIDTYVRANYPDLRKTINTIQMNVVDGVLKSPKEELTGSDWRLNMVAMFRENKVREARKLICANATATDYDEIYTFLYRNIEFFGATEDTQDEAIIVIRNGMVKHGQVADPEINLSATMIELEQISKTG